MPIENICKFCSKEKIILFSPNCGHKFCAYCTIQSVRYGLCMECGTAIDVENLPQMEPDDIFALIAEQNSYLPGILKHYRKSAQNFFSKNMDKIIPALEGCDPLFISDILSAMSAHDRMRFNLGYDAAIFDFSEWVSGIPSGCKSYLELKEIDPQTIIEHDRQIMELIAPTAEKLGMVPYAQHNINCANKYNESKGYFRSKINRRFQPERSASTHFAGIDWRNSDVISDEGKRIGLLHYHLLTSEIGEINDNIFPTIAKALADLEFLDEIPDLFEFGKTKRHSIETLGKIYRRFGKVYPGETHYISKLLYFIKKRGVIRLDRLEKLLAQISVMSANYPLVGCDFEYLIGMLVKQYKFKNIGGMLVNWRLGLRRVKSKTHNLGLQIKID